MQGAAGWCAGTHVGFCVALKLQLPVLLLQGCQLPKDPQVDSGLLVGMQMCASRSAA